MSHKNGNRYSEDFRKMIVELYHAGQSVSELVSEYGVSDVSIYNSIRESKHINPRINPLILDKFTLNQTLSQI